MTTKADVATAKQMAFSVALAKKIEKRVLEEIHSFEPLPGVQGPQGERGLLGEQGPQGKRGPQGIEGRQGEKGDSGRDGRDGADGLPGVDGKDGRPGDTGPIGPKGEKGDQGLQGPEGPAGRDGKQGTKGQRGLRGFKGEKGAVGREGIQGIQGIPGPPGKDGTIGPEGPAGPIGPQGLQGEIGPVGPPGEKGDKGDDGKDADTEELQQRIAEINKELTAQINRRLTQISSEVAKGGGSGGSGSYSILDNRDVVFNKPSQLANNDVLIFDFDIQKFRTINMTTVINDIRAELEVQFDKLVDEANSTITYVGEAAPGSLANAAVWRIKQISEFANNLTQILWANDTETQDKVWNDRTTYTYDV